MYIDPDLLVSIGHTTLNSLVSQARAEGGGSDDGFCPSVVGMNSRKSEFDGSPGSS